MEEKVSLIPQGCGRAASNTAAAIGPLLGENQDDGIEFDGTNGCLQLAAPTTSGRYFLLKVHSPQQNDKASHYG